MSYDINIYQDDFLRNALSQGMGDWTGAPEIAEAKRAEMAALLRVSGFRPKPHEPGFAAFAAAQGFAVSEDFVRDDPEVLATASLFKNCLTLSIPASGRDTKSVQECLALGRDLIAGRNLGIYDPQSGEFVS